MATNPQIASGQDEAFEKNPHATPVSSYLGLGIMIAIAIVMLVLQVSGSPGF